MTDPTAPATIARLRELIKAAGDWPDLEPEDQSDGSFRCPLCDGQGEIEAEHVKDGRLEYGDDYLSSIVGVQVYGFGDAMAAMEALLPLLIKHTPALLDQLDAQAAEIDLLRRQTEELEKWKGIALVAEEVTDARIADLLENDAKATGHSFSDAAAVFQRKATRLQRELDVIRASRDDLEDERHRLAVKAEGYQSRVAELERLAAERLDLLADCLEQIGLRDERGLWDGALSTAEELIEHMVKAGRLIRVPGEGPERWEWVGNG